MTKHFRTNKYPQRCRSCNGNGHNGPKQGRRYQACRICRGRGYLA